MSKARATWNSRYEKGLVDIMRDHVNIPLCRGQNGWSGGEVYPNVSFSTLHKAATTREGKGAKGQL